MEIFSGPHSSVRMARLRIKHLQQMTTTEIFLIALTIIFAVPYLVWRVFKTDFYAPLVVVQIIAGVLLGPGVFGHFSPETYGFIFNKDIISILNGLAWWAVMIFVFLAGIELDLHLTWKNRKETSLTAGLALGTPLLLGALVAVVMLRTDGWIGEKGYEWQFIVGIGMSCAVTALPILILLLEKLNLFREPIGQRILRYASLDDIAIWGVLALVLMDWQRIGKQAIFIVVFFIACVLFRKLMRWLQEKDRWYVALIWLCLCALGADWCGLHYMVGAFLAGVVIDAHWFKQEDVDALRRNVLLVLMPIFFLSTGLKTNWSVGGSTVFIAAFGLLAAAIIGKLIGVQVAGKMLKWKPHEASLIGWLLQTKALIMIIFSNILLDKQIITNATFTALLLMAIMSTMMAIPFASRYMKKVNETKHITFR